jgi:hypothetical protein
MAKFNIGDIVVPIDTPENHYSITNYKNKYVGKVVEILDHGEIRLETVTISPTPDTAYFLGRDLYKDYVVNENFFVLNGEENNKNQKEKTKMKTESTTINATPNALQSVIDLIGKYSIKKDGTETTPQEIIAVQIYVAKDGLKSQRAYRSVDAYVNIEDLVIFDLPQLKFVPHTDTETVDDKMEEDVSFTIDDIIAEEKPANKEPDWDRLSKRFLDKTEKKELYDIYKSRKYSPDQIAKKLGLKSGACVWNKIMKIKEDLGLKK